MNSLTIRIKYDPLFEAIKREARRNDKFMRDLETIDDPVMCEFYNETLVCHFTDDVMKLFYEAKGV